MNPQNYPNQRIIVVGGNSLLEEGVTRLLSMDANLQVSSITYIDDATLLQDISHVRPDVMILNEAKPLDGARIQGFLFKGASSVHEPLAGHHHSTEQQYDRCIRETQHHC